jgi:hypothetical protein
MTRRAAAAVAAALGLGACSGRKAAPADARVGPASAAAPTAAAGAREPWRCAAPDGPGAPDEILAIGGQRWRVAGHTLTLEGDPPGELAIGVIADAAGSAPATLAALRRLRDRLGRVALVVSLGGMGTTAEDLDAVFAALADRAAWPLVALPGDLEPVPAQIAAIALARRRGAAVVDGRLVQRIALPGVTIAVLPGAAAVTRLAAGADGCRYRNADVTTALAELSQQPGLRVAALAEPPVTGAERSARALAAGGGAGAIDLVLRAPIHGGATAARTGGRDGAMIALTPGSSDATPRLPGGPRIPTAGVLTVRGHGWTWQPVADVN